MPILTVKEFKMALLHFREIDVSTTKGKAKLIDTFINKIFVYDDKIKIIYNVNGKEENITKEELESSNFEQHAQPSTLTEITDSVKKESKTLVFDSFCMFFAHF